MFVYYRKKTRSTPEPIATAISVPMDEMGKRNVDAEGYIEERPSEMPSGALRRSF
jgi:hypothetical protein